jgi:hypothetical protein
MDIRNRGSSGGLVVSAIAKEDLEEAVVNHADAANYARSVRLRHCTAPL